MPEEEVRREGKKAPPGRFVKTLYAEEMIWGAIGKKAGREKSMSLPRPSEANFSGGREQKKSLSDGPQKKGDPRRKNAFLRDTR